jgi:hypothetical protein
LVVGSLETAGHETRVLALDIPERDDILKMLADCTPGLGALRAVLLQQHAL